MTTNFSPDTFNILNFSKEEASRLHCGSVSPLHLLLGILRHTQFDTAQQVIDTLKAEVEQHRDGAEPNDDLTMMCIRVD